MPVVAGYSSARQRSARGLKGSGSSLTPFRFSSSFRFVSNLNRVLQREQLIGSRDVSPTDRSIDVRISRLRCKLEPDAKSPAFIKTVYGAGYLFMATVNWPTEPGAKA